MSPFIGIIIAIIWFIYSAVSKSKKEQQKRQRQKPLAEGEPETTGKQTFKNLKEIMEEMRRQMQEQENVPQNKKPVIEFREQKAPKQITNKQILVQDRTLVSESESKEATEYREFVNKQRIKKYVFVNDPTNDDPRVTLVEDEEVVPLDYEIDLKNIVIADVIMNPPRY